MKLGLLADVGSSSFGGSNTLRAHPQPKSWLRSSPLAPSPPPPSGSNAMVPCTARQGWRNRLGGGGSRLGPHKWQFLERTVGTRYLVKLIPFREIVRQIRWLLRFRRGFSLGPWKCGYLGGPKNIFFRKHFILSNWAIFKNSRLNPMTF